MILLAEGRKMTAIEIFKRIEASERSLNTAARKVELYKCMAERITSTLEGEVVSRSRNVHSFEDSVLRLSEAKDELRIASDYYSVLVDFITEKMNELEEQDDEDLLSYYHLQHIPLAEISTKLHHSRTWGYRRYEIALKKRLIRYVTKYVPNPGAYSFSGDISKGTSAMDGPF